MSAAPLDELDRALLALLTADGRTSYADLARDTGLSTSAVHQRVRRLEQRSVIQGYAARIDPVAVGLPLAAFISIQPIDPAAPDDAPERLRHLTAVEACHSVAGDESYILQVRVAGPAELEQLLQEVRALAGVSTRTTVVLSAPWQGRTAPLPPPD
ncbi:MAG: Lrp/AsnC family transcriptional regulator [Ornithinimicrobium sp.]|uniref:Lrp/AsnC family transcriptional regulator n=1 Tax=Ornithinimicrobium sp. TaxID=1977084 RepID=UPI003D9B574B